MRRIARMRGAILLLALIYLFLLALVATSVVESSTQQLHMANNELFAAQALVRARAVASEVARYGANFDPASPVGAVRCFAASAGAGCDSGGLAALPEELAGAGIEYRVVRRAPATLEGVPLGGGEVSAAGAPFALFEVRVEVVQDGAQGTAVRGVMLGLPAAEGATPPGGDRAGELYGVYWRFPATDPL